MKISTLPFFLSVIAGTTAFAPMPVANPAVKNKLLMAVPLSDLSSKEVNEKLKETFPEIGFLKRRLMSKNKKIKLLEDSPKVLTGGKVEWSTKKGASTFGLALDQAPPKKESPTAPFPKAVDAFPGALTNKELLQMIDTTLTKAGYDKDKTLVACSLCCDEVNRPLELDLADAYTSNFNMGGLAGFPFGGAVAFGAMAAHIPDGGSTLLVYGPHVGVDSTGAVGTVERRGRENGGSCCGSAVAASGYVGDVLAGKTEEAAIPDDPMHAQQYFVGKMLLPYAEKLEAADEKMVELPYALYEAQTDMVGRIVEKACGGVAGDGKIAVLGGIQINTPEAYSDYFLPRSFELYDNKGELVEDLMS